MELSGSRKQSNESLFSVGIGSNSLNDLGKFCATIV